jgi:hypothetical protein
MYTHTFVYIYKHILPKLDSPGIPNEARLSVMFLYIYLYLYIYIYIYLYTYICIYIYVCIYICTYIYIWQLKQDYP